VTFKNKVAVKISGKEYTLVGIESDDYMLKVASYIDKKFSEFHKKNPNLNSSMVAVLTSVNIADELFKAVDSEARAIEKIDKYSNEMDRLKLQLSQMTKEIELLNEKNSSLAKDLERKDLELGEYKSSYDIHPKVKFYSK
jgi:cell division protein ZapA